jgi:hypothetical protein
VKWIGWELTGVAERLAVLVPLLLHHGQPLDEKIGERRQLQQYRPPLELGVAEHLQAFTGEVSLLPVLRASGRTGTGRFAMIPVPASASASRDEPAEQQPARDV